MNCTPAQKEPQRPRQQYSMKSSQSRPLQQGSLATLDDCTQDSHLLEPDLGASLAIVGSNRGPDATQAADHHLHSDGDFKADYSSMGSSTNWERLLRPIAGGNGGYSTETQELAQVIAREIFVDKPNVLWSDIVGLDEANYPDHFRGLLAPWKGLLLFGPPGTGKTMLAKALATETSTTFFNISAASVVSKYRGDSEKLVRTLFEMARYHAPSTIFVDEIESLMKFARENWAVDLDGRFGSHVFLLAASNLAWELDAALLRRLKKRIFVSLPTTDAREQMLRHHLSDHKASSQGVQADVSDHVQARRHDLGFVVDVDYARIAALTEGYSGSDLRLVCKEAAMRVVRTVFNRLESIDLNSSNDQDKEAVTLRPLMTDDLLVALQSTKSSANENLQRYEEWSEQYQSV
eukprot:Clim_evm15s2 gene=Clim_evmTU15s2